MTSVNFIIKQIKCDIHNIQEYIKILPKCKKTRYSLVQNNIKTLIKEIRYQKSLISDEVYKKHFRHTPALFEVEPSEIEQIDITQISSFFGIID